MQSHYFQHVPFEGLGSIDAWLQAAGHTISCSRLFESPCLPDPGEPDFLVVMGGPMSANDESNFPWLVQEKAFIREFIALGKPVLGICLGAQLIASALGARVYPNPVREIGWLPVAGVSCEDASLFQFPPSLAVFHWHGDTFDLPPGAVRIASSVGCVNQAFQLGGSVIGLQFHLETTPESARQLVTHCGDELVPAEYVQSAAEIISAPAPRYDAINQTMAEVLTFLLAGRC
ncbi:MAG: gamma-glutamyl-gamma-aminobutyrate hydrolase family protein [Gammaproteobacteria bacterium]|nr:gamma-glutamyl-gamma-aminobutyrate hydrolase family protein [Gammaproteobacteria bacterium]